MGVGSGQGKVMGENFEGQQKNREFHLKSGNVMIIGKVMEKSQNFVEMSSYLTGKLSKVS